MGIFEKFHQKHFAENADVFSTNGERNGGIGTKREVKNTFTSPARNPHSPHFGVARGKSAENAEKPPPQNIDTPSHESTGNLSDWQFPDHLPTLPTDCPLVDGGECPPGCRFETRFMIRMIETGVLPDPEIGCPLRHVCGLFSEWPRIRPEYPEVEDVPPAPEPDPKGEPGDCDQCPACDQETGLCHHTAFFEHKAGRPVPCAQIRTNCPRRQT